MSLTVSLEVDSGLRIPLPDLIVAVGIFGMMMTLNKTMVEATLLVQAFIPGDLIKAVLAGFITSGLAKARPASLLSRS